MPVQLGRVALHDSTAGGPPCLAVAPARGPGERLRTRVELERGELGLAGGELGSSSAAVAIRLRLSRPRRDSVVSSSAALAAAASSPTAAPGSDGRGSGSATPGRPRLKLVVGGPHQLAERSDANRRDEPGDLAVPGREQGVEGLIERLRGHAIGLRLVEHPEPRIEANRDRVGGEEPPAEAVDRRDPRSLAVAAQLREQLRPLTLGVRGAGRELGPHAVSKLGGRLLGEREGEDPVDSLELLGGGAVALDEHPGLAGPGAGLEQHVAVARLDRAPLLRRQPRPVLGRRRHLSELELNGSHLLLVLLRGHARLGTDGALSPADRLEGAIARAAVVDRVALDPPGSHSGDDLGRLAAAASSAASNSSGSRRSRSTALTPSRAAPRSSLRRMPRGRASSVAASGSYTPPAARSPTGVRALERRAGAGACPRRGAWRPR